MTTETHGLPEMTPTVAPSTPLPRSRGWFRQLGVDTGYALLSLPVAVVAFAVVVTGLALGVGLLIVWVGVAVLAATLLAARALATAPLPRLAALPAGTGAAWRAGDPAAVRSLAALELRRLGLRLPDGARAPV